MKKAKILSCILAILVMVSLIASSAMPAFAITDPVKGDLNLIDFDSLTKEDFIAKQEAWAGAMSPVASFDLVSGGLSGNALQITQNVETVGGKTPDIVAQMGFQKNSDGVAQLLDLTGYQYFRFWVKTATKEEADKTLDSISIRLMGNFNSGSNNNEICWLANSYSIYLNGKLGGADYIGEKAQSGKMAIPCNYEGYVYVPATAFAPPSGSDLSKVRIINFVIPGNRGGDVTLLDAISMTNADPTKAAGTKMLIDFEGLTQAGFIAQQESWAGAMTPTTSFALVGGLNGRGLQLTQNTVANDKGVAPDVVAQMGIQKNSDGVAQLLDLTGYKYFRFWVKTATKEEADKTLDSISIRLMGNFNSGSNNNEICWLANSYSIYLNGKLGGADYIGEKAQSGKMAIPCNYEGYIYLPATAFAPPSGSDLSKVRIINFVLPGNRDGDITVLDEICVTNDEISVMPPVPNPNNDPDPEPGTEPEPEPEPEPKPELPPIPERTGDLALFNFDNNTADNYMDELVPYAPEEMEDLFTFPNNFALINGGATSGGKALQITQNRAAGDIVANIAFKKENDRYVDLDARGYKYFRVWVKTPVTDEDGGMDYVSFRLKGDYGAKDCIFLKNNSKCYLNGKLNGNTYNEEFYNSMSSNSFLLPYNYEGYLYIPMDRFDIYANGAKDTEPTSVTFDKMRWLILVLPGAREGRISVWDDFSFTNAEPTIGDNSSTDPTDTNPTEPTNSTEPVNSAPVSPETGVPSMVVPALAVLCTCSVVAVTAKSRRAKK